MLRRGYSGVKRHRKVHHFQASKSAPPIWTEGGSRRSGGVAERRSLSGGRDAGAAFAQAIALAFERDHRGVVDEPVDQGGGDHRVAEDLAPLLEAAVRGDRDRAAFVAAGDERQEKVGCLALQRQVADLVDDQEVVALESAELLLELVAVLRGLEA